MDIMYCYKTYLILLILVLAAPPCMLLHCQKTEFDNFWSILYQTFYTVELTCY